MSCQYEVAQHVKFISNLMDKECAAKQAKLRRFEFCQILTHLNATERFLIAHHFCKSSWNVGSLRVLSVLQQLRILTATEFILSLQDTTQIQLILNDFLETEFTLIEHFFNAANYDNKNTIKLNAIIDECLRCLFQDLLQQPNLNDLSYLKLMAVNLCKDLVLKITQKHISSVLSLHTSSSTKEAFHKFSAWINEGVDDIKFTGHLYANLLRHNEQDVLNYLFKLSTLETFKEWKFYLILLQTIASKCVTETAQFMRKYFKNRLRQIAAKPNIIAFLHLLLTIRAATATTMDIVQNINAYADWYKQNIGEMKFVLSTEEFQNILNLLEQTIKFEMETDYLEVHATISISPPVLCGKMVQNYKAKCKQQLSQLKGNTVQQQQPPCKDVQDFIESIVIDSD